MSGEVAQQTEQGKASRPPQAERSEIKTSVHVHPWTCTAQCMSPLGRAWLSGCSLNTPPQAHSHSLPLHCLFTASSNGSSNRPSLGLEVPNLIHSACPHQMGTADVHDLFRGCPQLVPPMSPQLVPGGPTTCSVEVHNMFRGSPELVLCEVHEPVPVDVRLAGPGLKLDWPQPAQAPSPALTKSKHCA